jgi:hypothetical protein
MRWRNGGKCGDTGLCRMVPTAIGNFFILFSKHKNKEKPTAQSNYFKGII